MPLTPGSRLGQYELEHHLGAGGMGVVHRAFDTRLERPVAIKLLHPSTEFDSSRRLLNEARAACALNHPNICTVHEVAEHGDHSFIVMEFIDGRPLSDVIADGSPPAPLALSMALQIAGALSHAHDRRIVHGDLKTANVLVLEGSRVKVVDFGLARRHQGGTEGLTQSSVSGGTPYTSAPEQLRGAPADTRSDVWALGVLLQELTSGTRPFWRPNLAELLAAILTESPTAVPSHVNPALRRIIERCLARDPASRYQSAGEVLAALDAVAGSRIAPIREEDAAWTLPPPPAVTAAGSSQIVMTGREEEWRLLRAAWERSVTGRRQLALVAGEPGIGKTRLVMEFARSIAAEGYVLLGRCDQEALVPQQPFVEALEWYARQCPPAVLEGQLANVDGVWELAQLVAPLARRVAVIHEPVESNPEGRRYRLFEAVAALVSAIAGRQPLLMVLEDLHWADRPTLLLLRHLLRSSHEARLCLVATYRETELGRTHPLAEVLADLRREDGVTRIGLRGLEETDVSRLLGHWTGRETSASLTRLVASNTEGNPFFICEVLRHLEETGALSRILSDPRPIADLGGLPEGVREAIGRRLTRLSDECNRALGLAAVVGREFTLPVLLALSDMSEGALLDVIDEASAARLVHAVPGVSERYTFTHALVRDTLYGELTPARRSRLHRQVAEVLDRLAAEGDRPLADLAYHYAHAASAADAHKAIECAVGAAERAAASFALEEAARFYDIALQAADLPSGGSVCCVPRGSTCTSGEARRLPTSVFGDRRAPSSRRLCHWWIETIRRAEHAVLLELSKCTFWMLDCGAVRLYATEALSLAESLRRDDLVADAMSWAAGVLNAEGDAPGAVEMDRQAMARVGGPKTFGLARTVITLYHLGLIDEAIERAVQAVENARASQDPNFRVYALQHLAICLAGAGRYSEACRAFEEMREFGRRHGVLPMLARGNAMFAGIHISLGNYQRGLELANEARELARRISFPPPFVSAGIDLLTIFARSHDPGRADSMLDDVSKAVVAASGWHGWLWRLRLSQARAELALERGEWQPAIEAATEGIADSEARSRPKYVALGLLTRAAARKALDDVPRATADASRSVEIARGLSDPALLLRALNVRIGLEGTDALAEEARACSNRILANLDDRALREHFLGSELAANR